MTGPTPPPHLAHVLSPLTLRGRTLRNRVLITGHSVLYGENGHFSQRHADYYAERARGGAALVLTEQQAAHPAGRNYRTGLLACDPAAVPAYRMVSGAIQAHGALAMAQLFCGGPQGQGTQYMDAWKALQSPSGIRSTQFGEIPAAMTAADIADLRAHFVQSALNVRDGGFDGIEIHAAHSQLLGSFLSPAFNRRTDAYGGSVAARCRLVVEIAEAVRAAVGEGMILAVRLCASEYLDGAGIEPDEAEEHVRILSAAGVLDAFDISAGGYFAKSMAVPPMASPLPSGFLGDFTARVRRWLPREQALFSVGRITRLEEAEALVAAGAADMVGMTRAHMADPHLVAKTLAGRDDIMPCVGANICSRRLGEQTGVVCVLNPRMGREADWPLPVPQAPRRRVVVVGAGPCGLRAGAIAAAAGHEVTVFEAGAVPGGRLRSLAALPLRRGWTRATEALCRGLSHAGGRLLLETPADAAAIAALAPDHVLLATGAAWDIDGYTPFRPGRSGVPGLDAVSLFGFDTAVAHAAADPSTLGRRVLLVDETLDGAAAGLALMLAEAGTAVAIASPVAGYALTLSRTYELSYFWGRMERAGVTVHEMVTLDAVAPDGSATLGALVSDRQITVADLDGIVFAAGRSPRAGLAAALAATGLGVRVIGDALAPRALEAVLHDGEKAARALAATDGREARA